MKHKWKLFSLSIDIFSVSDNKLVTVCPELTTMSDTDKASTSGTAPGAEEEGVTMIDVLEEEEALEDDCAAVLGNVSDTACTYSQGYLARQPLYAAREATVEGQRAGVCLACSYHCLEVS